MIPIVRKIYVVLLALFTLLLIILVGGAFGDLGILNAHGGFAPGLLAIYVLPIFAIFLMVAIPMAIRKLLKLDSPTKGVQWMIIFSAPTLLVLNFLLLLFGLPR